MTSSVDSVMTSPSRLGSIVIVEPGAEPAIAARSDPAPESALVDTTLEVNINALTTMLPETADSDWSWKDFQSRVNDDLADNLGNFVARTLRFVDRFFDGTLAPLGELSPADADILEAGSVAASEISAHLHAFEFRKAAGRLMAFCSDCNGSTPSNVRAESEPPSRSNWNDHLPE